MSKRIVVWVQEFTDRENLVLQWNDPVTGKRKSKSAGTADKKEAEAKRCDLEADLNAGRHVEPSKQTWGEFRDAFEREYLAGARKNTRDAYRFTLNHFQAICSPKTLASVNERMVSAFMVGMRNKSHAPSSIVVRLRCLHAALAWAHGQKLISHVPQFPEVKVPRKKPQPVPEGQVERLLAQATNDHWRAYLLSGWLAGLRLREAYYLEWNESDLAPWLNLDRNRIIFPAEAVKAAEDQWVPLDPKLREALEALPRAAARVFNLGTTASHVSNAVRALAVAAGVKLTMRSLRRGFGCRYAARVPAQVLQRLMRHSNIAITMDFYANIDSAIEQAVLGNSSRNTG